MNKFIIPCALLVILLSCKQSDSIADRDQSNFVMWTGKTMGTYYAINFESKEGLTFAQEAIDSLLVQINQGLSTYIDTSLISRVNRAGISFDFRSEPEDMVGMFSANYEIASEIYQATEGYYDVSIMPLVNYWGFGYKKRSSDFVPDQAEIEKLLLNVGFGKYQITNLVLTKPVDGSLDFSSVAKGYGVDRIIDFMQARGITNVMVDIGGEVKAMGSGKYGEGWIIGISKPDPKAQSLDISAKLRLSNKAVATSGNYRNYYVSETGEKYVHTINPLTGKAQESNLLSATVVADDCARADAWATAMMASGTERSKELLMNNSIIEGVLIYTEGDSILEYMTPGVIDLLIK